MAATLSTPLSREESGLASPILQAAWAPSAGFHPLQHCSPAGPGPMEAPSLDMVSALQGFPGLTGPCCPQMPDGSFAESEVVRGAGADFGISAVSPRSALTASSGCRRGTEAQLQGGV